jgi:hypothetical protein
LDDRYHLPTQVVILTDTSRNTYTPWTWTTSPTTKPTAPTHFHGIELSKMKNVPLAINIDSLYDR